MTASPSRQRGAVLLLLLLALVLFGATVLLDRLNTAAQLKATAERRTADALLEAKRALIAYAVTRYEDSQEFGALPCPDTDTALLEGQADLTCGGKYVSSQGRFPWRNLELPPLKDGAGECLWYAVSGGYKAPSPASAPDMRNEDMAGSFVITNSQTGAVVVGNTEADRAVAVVFAPGLAVRAQDRTPLAIGVDACGGNYTAANYLDIRSGISNALGSPTADAVSNFMAFNLGDDRLATSAVDPVGNQPANDRLVYITRQELWDAVKARSDFCCGENLGPPDTSSKMAKLTRAVAECLAEFGRTSADERLPWAAPVNLADYRDPRNYDDQTGVLFGRVPYDVRTSANAVHSMDDDAAEEYLSRDNNQCPGTIWTEEVDALYRHWKDHLFYVVSDEYKPDLSEARQPCASGDCVSIAVTRYAALVIFAGSPLVNPPPPATPVLNQVRLPAPPGGPPDEKADIDNYLEGLNATNYPDPNGNLVYEARSIDSTFNDLVYAIQSVPPGLGVTRLTP